MVVFLIFYIDDILLIGNDVDTLSLVKLWLSNQFDIKDLGEVSHILGIKLIRDRQKRMLGLSKATYIDTVLVRFSMQNSKKGFISFRLGKSLSSNQHPKTHAEIERIRGISYALTVESLMYIMLCTRSDICFFVGIVRS